MQQGVSVAPAATGGSQATHIAPPADSKTSAAATLSTSAPSDSATEEPAAASVCAVPVVPSLASDTPASVVIGVSGAVPEQPALSSSEAASESLQLPCDSCSPAPEAGVAGGATQLPLPSVNPALQPVNVSGGPPTVSAPALLPTPPAYAPTHQSPPVSYPGTLFSAPGPVESPFTPAPTKRHAHDAVCEIPPAARPRYGGTPDTPPGLPWVYPHHAYQGLGHPSGAPPPSLSWQAVPVPQWAPSQYGLAPWEALQASRYAQHQSLSSNSADGIRAAYQSWVMQGPAYGAGMAPVPSHHTGNPGVPVVSGHSFRPDLIWAAQNGHLPPGGSVPPPARQFSAVYPVGASGVAQVAHIPAHQPPMAPDGLPSTTRGSASASMDAGAGPTHAAPHPGSQPAPPPEQPPPPPPPSSHAVPDDVDMGTAPQVSFTTPTDRNPAAAGSAVPAGPLRTATWDFLCRLPLHQVRHRGYRLCRQVLETHGQQRSFAPARGAPSLGLPEACALVVGGAQLQELNPAKLSSLYCRQIVILRRDGSAETHGRGDTPPIILISRWQGRYTPALPTGHTAPTTFTSHPPGPSTQQSPDATAASMLRYKSLLSSLSGKDIRSHVLRDALAVRNKHQLLPLSIRLKSLRAAVFQLTGQAEAQMHPILHAVRARGRWSDFQALAAVFHAQITVFTVNKQGAVDHHSVRPPASHRSEVPREIRVLRVDAAQGSSGTLRHLYFPLVPDCTTPSSLADVLLTTACPAAGPNADAALEALFPRDVAPENRARGSADGARPAPSSASVPGFSVLYSRSANASAPAPSSQRNVAGGNEGRQAGAPPPARSSARQTTPTIQPQHTGNQRAAEPASPVPRPKSRPVGLPLVPPNVNNACWLNSTIASVLVPHGRVRDLVLGGEPPRLSSVKHMRTLATGNTDEAVEAHRSMWTDINATAFRSENPLRHKDVGQALEHLVVSSAATKDAPSLLLHDALYSSECSKCKHGWFAAQSNAVHWVPIAPGENPSLSSCLAASRDPSVVDDINCPICKSKQPGTRASAPIVMGEGIFIGLCRFKEQVDRLPTGKVSISYVKNRQRVSIPTVIPASDVLVAAREGLPAIPAGAKLTLQAAIVHSGGMEGGHYYCYVALPGPDSKLVWYKFDDDKDPVPVTSPDFSDAYILRYALVGNKAAPALLKTFRERYHIARGPLDHENPTLMPVPAQGPQSTSLPPRPPQSSSPSPIDLTGGVPANPAQSSSSSPIDLTRDEEAPATRTLEQRPEAPTEAPAGGVTASFEPVGQSGDSKSDGDGDLLMDRARAAQASRPTA